MTEDSKNRQTVPVIRSNLIRKIVESVTTRCKSVSRSVCQCSVELFYKHFCCSTFTMYRSFHHVSVYSIVLK